MNKDDLFVAAVFLLKKRVCLPKIHDLCSSSGILKIFFFAFHACGLRVVDVMTLQWKHIDFARKELRKIMTKTNKRHAYRLLNLHYIYYSNGGIAQLVRAHDS